MSQHGGADDLVDSRSPPGSPQPQPPPGIRRGTSQWSEPHNAGTSYFPPPLPRRSTNANVNQNPSSSRYSSTAGGGGTTGRKRRRSAPVRSSSLASSSRHGGGAGGGAVRTPRRDTGVFSEADEDADRGRFGHDSVESDTETDNVEDQNEETGNEGNVSRNRDTGLVAEEEEDDPVTLKERQSLINDEHPFGLPIWKPALYRKSRGITREAEFALHGVPVPSAARDLLLPGNVAWTIFFGWWLALAMILPSLILSIIPWGGSRFAPVVYGLGWYLFWPFGRYVEGEISPGSRPESSAEDEEAEETPNIRSHGISRSDHSTAGTIRGAEGNSTVRAALLNVNGAANTTAATGHAQTTSWNSATESTRLLPNNNSGSSNQTMVVSKSYGTLPTYGGSHPTSASTTPWKDRFAKACYYYFFFCNIAPLLLIVCTICWACVFTIPMAKLTWELLIHMFVRPESIRFCSAPKVKVPSVEDAGIGGSEAIHSEILVTREPTGTSTGIEGRALAAPSHPYPTTLTTSTGGYTVKRAKLRAGQLAPSGNPDSTVLLCIYRAVGSKYYKYTIGGVNIFFVNLLPVVFFVIFDGIILLPLVEGRHHRHEKVPAFLDFIAGQATIFLLSLASVIPLSYFIGMAVASISAQSSIGMGAVINATFGSIIEIILYAIALTQRKGRLVEGSIVGSILAGVLLMPGMSMCSSALRRKEQVFNAKSASVTSTMLIMAIFGTLTPTLFYQTYGNFQLVCDGCPDVPHSFPDNMSPVVGLPGELTAAPPWTCKHCYYQLPDPVTDPFYQGTVKPLMYFCASILVFSYLIGLWFSLRTHASQIWQNPRQLMDPQHVDLGTSGAAAGSGRLSLYHRLLHMPSSLQTHHRRPESLTRQPHRKASIGTTTTTGSTRGVLAHSQSTSMARSGDGTVRAVPAPINTTAANDQQQQQQNVPSHITLPLSPSVPRRPGAVLSGVGYMPNTEHITRASKAVVDPMFDPTVINSPAEQGQTQLSISADEFAREGALATSNALRQGILADATAGHVRRLAGVPVPVSGLYETHHSVGGHGGHDAPSWSRAVSATVLLGCTLLYAVIAEILVDVVDIVLIGSGIDEKFLGATLFALVPNVTEFMNAMSFALNGNISLSMEIGSAYALQVCLLQIPAMVAFSAWYDPRHMGSGGDTFTLIFPRWDVIAITLSIFLLTYTYIEAKSNYHRGSILILSYLVMASGFYFAPHEIDETRIHMSRTALDWTGPYLHIFKTYALSLFSR